MFTSREVTRNKFLKLLSILPYGILITSLVFLTIPIDAEAHPGPKGEDGCHFENGKKHCHRKDEGR